MDQSSLSGNASAAPAIKAHPSWIFCPCCEAPCRDRTLSAGTELRCKRCGVRVKAARGTCSLQSALAFSTAGLFAAILANLNPVLIFDVAGDRQSGWIITGADNLYEQGYWPIAALVFFASILAPILYLAAVWYVSAACLLRFRLPLLREALAGVEMLEPWNLVPVYAIATVVSVVKLRMMGSVEWQLGARWVLALAICSLFASQAFKDNFVREKLRSLGNH